MNQFKIFAPEMIASRDADGTMRIEGVASSTVRDAHGDQLTRRALEKMAATARGLTIFLNHEYKVPEDVFGTVERVKLTRSGVVDPLTGEEIYDLRFGIAVQKANPRAVQAFEQMEPGPGKSPTKLGLSIGAMVPEGGAKFDKSAGGRYIVDDVDLVETSLVSMPANPRSWVENVVKAIAKDVGTLNSLPLSITKQRNALAEVMEAEGIAIVDTIDEEDLTPDKPDEVNVIEAPTNDDALEMDTDGEEGDRPEDSDSAGEDDPSAAVTEPVEKTRVTVWDGDKTVEVDTGRSKPKTEDSSAQANDGSGDAGSPAVATKDLLGDGESEEDGDDPVASHIVKSDRLVLAMQAQLRAKNEEVDSVKAERDVAIKAAEMAIESTQALIQRLMDSPMGRKAVLVEAEAEVTQLRNDLYDPEVQRLMLKQKG